MPKRPLYFMAKPPGGIADVIWSLPRTSRRRQADLLHITILPLADLADVPAQTLPALIEIMTNFDGAAFRVIYDRIAERMAITLRGSEPMLGALAFQRQLTQCLTVHRFPFLGRPPEPHLTINYRRDGLGNEAIEPISWQVREVLLIESVYGQSRHIVHGHWPLRGRTG